VRNIPSLGPKIISEPQLNNYNQQNNEGKAEGYDEYMVNLEEVAHKAVEVSLGVKSGETVWIHGWDHTIDLISLLGWECRKRGCQVLLTVQPEDFWLRSITEAPLALINRLSRLQASALRKTGAYIFTLGPRKPIPWERIPEERRKAVSIWLDEHYDKSTFAKEWAKIARDHKVRMLAIEATFATPERANALGLNYEEWKEIMLTGCIADYHEVAKRGRSLTSPLSGDEEVHITTPCGTDLRFRLDRRPVDVSDGFTSKEKAEKGMVTFLPAGGIEVTASEESAEGKVVYDAPVRVESGTAVGLTLQIKNGRIMKFAAREHKELFADYLQGGKGDFNRFASFGFGLNPLLRHGFTQDDKVLGEVTIGFGDNENKGGKNKADNGWWASITGATVTVGDTKVMRDGVLLV
jgi:leucyl aminopeptidase (aminopeptidase T)